MQELMSKACPSLVLGSLPENGRGGAGWHVRRCSRVAKKFTHLWG